MIKVEGYKAFHGLMRIESKSKRVPVIEIEGDWLYKPHTNCWYGKGASYPEKICTVVRDDSEKMIPKKTTKRQYVPNGTLIYGHCANCDSFTKNDLKYCGKCGQTLDWSEDE